MNHSSFIIQKSELIKELQNISKVIGRMSKKNKDTVLEITIIDEKLIFVVPGAKIYLDCETKNSAKGTINFFYFSDVIKTHRYTAIKCDITDNLMNINNIVIPIQTTFFETDRILRSIKLPLNYSDWHILRLERDGYTKEEIAFNRLNTKINVANKNLNLNLRKVVDILKIYGVNKNDIEEIVRKKLNI
jgi:hypothetical protein